MFVVCILSTYVIVTLIYCLLQHRKDQIMSVELLDTDDAGDEENQHEIMVIVTHNL